MELFHGAAIVVESPDTKHSRKPGDFGKGFYATTSKKQSLEWALYRMHTDKKKSTVVNFYSIDDLLNNLKVKVFPKANAEWFHFVVNNRTKPEFSHPYDIVFGPVADDDAAMIISEYEKGNLTVRQALARLHPERLQNQFLFHTEAATACLNFKKAVEITYEQAKMGSKNEIRNELRL